MSVPDRPLRTAAVLLIGAIGVVALGVQSALFGGLERAGRIDVGEIGLAASLEMVALAIGVLLAGRLARSMPIVILGVAGGSALVAANAAMPFQSNEGIVILRVIAGLGGGLLLWLANAYVVQSIRVVRLAVMFLILQTVLQFSAAAGAAAFTADNPDGLSLIMAGCAAVSLLCMPAARGWTAIPEVDDEQPHGPFNANAMLALGLMALLQFSLVGGWILVELVGAAAGLAPATIAAATPMMLAAQILGGFGAMWLAGRVSWGPALVAVGALLAVVQWALAHVSAPVPFLAMAFGYGLLWNYSLPQLTPMGLAADASMRVARIGPASVVAGAALGPIAAAELAGRLSASQATVAFVVPSLAACALAAVLRSRLAKSKGRARYDTAVS